MDWHQSHELVLVELSEEAQISAHLHKRAYEHFSRRNVQFQMPIIILSVLSGSANFISSSSKFADYQPFIVLGVGGVSILTSIISSVSQFLKLGEYAEGHRIAYSSWEKYYARLNIQLKLKRENRDPANDFTSTAQAEYLRLKEMSPDVPTHISTAVRRKNKNALRNIHAPVEVTGFRPVRPFGMDEQTTKAVASTTSTSASTTAATVVDIPLMDLLDLDFTGNNTAPVDNSADTSTNSSIIDLETRASAV
jgi:hypothetical protein